MKRSILNSLSHIERKTFYIGYLYTACFENLGCGGCSLNSKCDRKVNWEEEPEDKLLQFAQIMGFKIEED